MAASFGFAIIPSSAMAFRLAGNDMMMIRVMIFDEVAIVMILIIAYIIGAAAGGLVGFIAKRMILETIKVSEDKEGDDDTGGGDESSSVILSPSSVTVAIDQIQKGQEITSLKLNWRNISKCFVITKMFNIFNIDRDSFRRTKTNR